MLQMSIKDMNLQRDKFCIEKGCDVYVANKKGPSLMQYAASFEFNVAIYELLLKTFTWNINRRDHLGNTVLHDACMDERVIRMVFNFRDPTLSCRILYLNLLYGVNVEIKNNYGKFPHFHCTCEDHYTPPMCLVEKFFATIILLYHCNSLFVATILSIFSNIDMAAPIKTLW